MTRVLTIHGCDECPLRDQFRWLRCNLAERELDDATVPRIPDWCPLPTVESVKLMFSARPGRTAQRD